jgi:hypothetical protein
LTDEIKQRLEQALKLAGETEPIPEKKTTPRAALKEQPRMLHIPVVIEKPK